MFSGSLLRGFLSRGCFREYVGVFPRPAAAVRCAHAQAGVVNRKCTRNLPVHRVIVGSSLKEGPIVITASEYEAWRETQLQPPHQNVNLVRAIDEHMCLLWRTYMQIQILRFTPVHGSMCDVYILRSKYQFVRVVTHDFQARLKDGGSGGVDNPKKVSLWDLLHALELADPTATERIGGNTWSAVEMMCARFALDYDTVRRQINRARQLGARLMHDDKDLAKSNLLCLMSKLDARTQWAGLVEYFKYVKACFCVFISTTIVESCFSIFAALKGKYRNALKDGAVIDALLTREAVDAFADASVSFHDLRLRFDALTHRLKW